MFLKSRRIIKPTKPVRQNISYLPKKETNRHSQIPKEVNDCKQSTPRLYNQSTYEIIMQDAIK